MTLQQARIGGFVSSRILEVHDDRIISSPTRRRRRRRQVAPAAGLKLSDKHAVNKALLTSGGTISEMSHQCFERAGPIVIRVGKASAVKAR